MSKIKAYGLAALLSMALVSTSYACGDEKKASCCSKASKEASAKGEKSCKKGKKCCKGEKAAASENKGKEKS